MEGLNEDELAAALASGVQAQRDYLEPFDSFRSKQSVTIELFADQKPQVGRGTTLHLFEAGQNAPFGSAYIKVREDELLLSNVDLGRKNRQGIGTELVASLLAAFPGHRVKGENPNLDALDWHTHLEQRFGDRMIPFTEQEIEEAHRRWGPRPDLSELSLPDLDDD